MTFKAGDTVALADQLGGHVVDVIDEYRPGLYQVRLDGCLDFVISSHVLRPVTEAEAKPQHVVEFRRLGWGTGWMVEHPQSCGMDCQVGRLAEHDLTAPKGPLPTHGRFECFANDLGDRLLIGDRVQERA